MVDVSCLIKKEFDVGGLVYEARSFNFSKPAAERLISNLNSINEGNMDRQSAAKIISAAWEIPMAMALYKDRCIKSGCPEDEYVNYMNSVISEIRRVVHIAIDRIS